MNTQFPAGTELIFVSRDLQLAQLPLELLTRLLAEAVAQDTKQPTALVMVTGASATSQIWGLGGFGAAAPVIAPLDSDKLRNFVGPRGRVFVVNQNNPQVLPALLFDPRTTFDRIVYLTDDVPRTMVPALASILDPKYQVGSEAYFSSYVPSVLTKLQPSPSPLAWLFSGTPFGGRFGVERMHYRPPNDPGGERARLFRDSCSLSFDPATIVPSQQNTPTTTLISALSPSDQASIRRWGRAVSNRRVGVAVSGGGASAFRLTALLKALWSRAVPVDVVTALSGGAILGAYYSAAPSSGLDHAATLGLTFQLGLPLVLLSSWPLQIVVDADTGGTRVQDLEVRFAALATELRPYGSPDAAVIAKGTLGEALRASGCLPPAFAPMRRNGRRYLDGGAAAIVPARIARDCGADLSVACDVIPGAAQSNPLDFIPILGTLLHDWTVLGRLLDAWVWYSFMWSCASRRYGEEADVAMHFQSQQIPYLESVLWIAASWIANDAANDPNVGAAAADAQARFANMT